MRDYGLGDRNRICGGRWVSLMMGIKEGTDCVEYWVLYANNESWNSTSKLMMYYMVTNITQ